MANTEPLVARDEEDVAAGAGVPGSLPVLKKWPAACRPDEDCIIEQEVYPAPSRLGAREVLWWIDLTQIRVSASRNLLNGSLGAIMAAALGAVATVIGTAVTSSLWGAVGAAGASVLVVGFSARIMLKDSDHAPLEERLMLYRQRARDLGVL